MPRAILFSSQMLYYCCFLSCQRTKQGLFKKQIKCNGLQAKKSFFDINLQEKSKKEMVSLAYCFVAFK